MKRASAHVSSACTAKVMPKGNDNVAELSLIDADEVHKHARSSSVAHI